MSLYNALFGVNPFANALLSILDTDISQVPRFRDVYVENDQIIIYTRTGGGNRDHYENCTDGPSNADLRKIPGYLWDADDDFDNTFAYFYYAIPESAQKGVARIVELTGDRPKPNEAWKLTIESGVVRR